MIQIERPVGWTKIRIRKLVMDLKAIEIYNSVSKHKYDITKSKWGWAK